MHLHQKAQPGFYRGVFRLAFPMVLQNLLVFSLGLADTFMVGRLPGDMPMAAVALAGIPTFVLHLLLIGLQSGASVLISQYWGQRDMDAINRVIGMGVYTSLAVTLPVAAVMYRWPLPFMSLFSSNHALAAASADYARIIGFSFVLGGVTQVYIGARRSMESPRIGLYVVGLSVVVNVFLNWVLIFGKFGAPALGVAGAALATLLSRILEFVVMFLCAALSRRYPLRPALLLRPGMAMARSFRRYGFPVVCNETLWGLGTALFPTVMGYMAESTEILSAYNIAGNINRIYSVVVFALANASAVLVGREIGAGRMGGVYALGATLNRLTLIIGVGMGIFMMAATQTVIVPHFLPLMDTSPRTTEICRMMLLILGASLPIQALSTTNIVGVLRAGGDVRMATIIDLLPLWLLSLPLCTLAAFALRLDIFWVYLCMMSEHVVKLLWSLHRFRSGLWINNLTGAAGPESSAL